MRLGGELAQRQLGSLQGITLGPESSISQASGFLPAVGRRRGRAPAVQQRGKADLGAVRRVAPAAPQERAGSAQVGRTEGPREGPAAVLRAAAGPVGAIREAGPRTLAISRSERARGRPR